MKKILLIIFSLVLCSQGFAQTINAGSYNIRTLNKKDAEHHDAWNERKAMVCGVIRTADFDIFGAQEVRHAQLEDMLEGLDGYAYVGVGRDDGKQGGEYSPVFYKKSRFTLLDSGTFWMSETPDRPSKGWDAKFNRVCSWGYFKDRLTKKKFYFFNLHMDHKGVEARRQSAMLLVKKVKEMCGEKSNFVITGDFNVAQDNDIFKIFTGCGFLNDSYETAAFRFAPTGTFNSFHPDLFTTHRIDHVWVSSSAKVERYSVLTFHYWRDKAGAEGTLTAAPKEIKADRREIHLPSDHYPLQVVIDFKK